jgi:hypothetical protein
MLQTNISGSPVRSNSSNNEVSSPRTPDRGPTTRSRIHHQSSPVSPTTSLTSNVARRFRLDSEQSSPLRRLTPTRITRSAGNAMDTDQDEQQTQVRSASKRSLNSTFDEDSLESPSKKLKSPSPKKKPGGPRLENIGRAIEQRRSKVEADSNNSNHPRPGNPNESHSPLKIRGTLPLIPTPKQKNQERMNHPFEDYTTPAQVAELRRQQAQAAAAAAAASKNAKKINNSQE